jgi:hypothetical protein
MKPGLNTGDRSLGPPQGVPGRIADAERLGFDSALNGRTVRVGPAVVAGAAGRLNEHTAPRRLDPAAVHQHPRQQPCWPSLSTSRPAADSTSAWHFKPRYENRSPLSLWILTQAACRLTSVTTESLWWRSRP